MTQQGNYTVIPAMPATALGNTRQVTILVPPGPGPFPVLYAHDGQNLFDPTRSGFGVEWELDEAANALYAQGIPFIIVGIDHGGNDRIYELTPVEGDAFGQRMGGGGELYLDFVEHDVKPYVDFHYNTRCEPEHTAMMGSSLGGLMSFHAYRTRSHAFGRLAALSPSLWWSDRWAVTQFNADAARQFAALWIDAGTQEGDVDPLTGWSYLVEDVRDVRDRARVLGHTLGVDLWHLEAEHMLHNEYAWSVRLRNVLLFLFGGPAPAPSAAYVHALRNPFVTSSSTVATLHAAYGDGRRITVPSDLAPLGSTNPSIQVGARGVVTASAPGTTTLSGSWQGVTGSVTAEAQANASLVEVVFEVDVPADTPPNATVVITGNLAALSTWDPAGVAMQKLSPTHWRRALLLPRGAYEYKYTMGSWATVEKAADGNELPNRAGCNLEQCNPAGADTPQTHHDRVARWAP
ncbi:MAG: hypothetical protein IPI55_17105 [Flavobacteriales bacterium]|nr:hypothetical protein [Flavobacteriales bacterium]